MNVLKTFSFKVVSRIVLMLITMIAIAYIFGDSRLFFNQIILSIVLIIQIIELLRFVKNTNRELSKFLLAIKHADFSVSFHNSKLGASFGELNEAFAGIIETYKKATSEKEAGSLYQKMIVNHLNIGVISIQNNADITLINPTAERLLAIEGVKNWRILKEKNLDFAKKIDEMGAEGRRLIEINHNSESLTLSVDVSSMKLLNKELKLITLQDIRNEIEQKEIEAWHKLIRILTHEIMNSATPISSLTETMQAMLEKNGKPITHEELTNETINDLRFSLKTIQRRSNGMLDFIDDYRKITRVPTPSLEQCIMAELLKEIEVLVNPILKEKGISLSITVEEGLTANLDQRLIEQVLLNLIKNAEHALVNTEVPKIELNAYQKGSKIVLDIKDNGAGIPKKELGEIFIPFYTTKKSGSGIGLSLSKQIMHLHQGAIKVSSAVGVGTTFFLQFKSD